MHRITDVPASNQVVACAQITECVMRPLEWICVFVAITASAFAQTGGTLYNFNISKDGENPQAGVVFDQAGNLYRTAALGGVQGNGVVFQLSPRSGKSVPWNETVSQTAVPPKTWSLHTRQRQLFASGCLCSKPEFNVVENIGNGHSRFQQINELCAANASLLGCFSKSVDSGNEACVLTICPHCRSAITNDVLGAVLAKVVVWRQSILTMDVSSSMPQH